MPQAHGVCDLYLVRLRTKGKVITLSVHPWVCVFVCVCVDTKMSTLSEVGKHVMCTYHVRARNEKIVASMYLTSESVFEELENEALSTYLKVAFNFHDLSLRRLLPHHDS